VQERTLKTIDAQGVIETECVRPFYTGDNVFPYLTESLPIRRALRPSGSPGAKPNRDAARLTSWWERAEQIWNENRSSERLSLMEQLTTNPNCRSNSRPALRIVYNRAGMHVVAAKITDRRALIASGLYWAAVRSLEEADYLCAILNAPITTELVRPFMSYGKDERDIHKHVWEVPIRCSIPKIGAPTLSQLGEGGWEIAAGFSRNVDLHFAQPGVTCDSCSTPLRKARKLTN